MPVGAAESAVGREEGRFDQFRHRDIRRIVRRQAMPQSEDPARQFLAVMFLGAKIQKPLEADPGPILGDPSLPL
jgi:hypothetical protein